MSDITTVIPNYLSAPDRHRKDHVPTKGNIYRDKHGEGFIRLGDIIRTVQKENVFACESYNFLTGQWEKSYDRGDKTLKEYYILVIGREGPADDIDWKVISSVAETSMEKDEETVMNTFQEMVNAPSHENTMALVTQNDAERVFSLTEQAENLQDRLDTIRCAMTTIVAQKRKEMEAKVHAMTESLKKIQEHVENLHRVITVMNLYTGRNVDLEIICDGAPAAVDAPIHIRQRILFANEEYMADAMWGGIDFRDMGMFYDWLKHPENRNIILPEEKCIVAIKPRRNDRHYSYNAFINESMNKWNRHTIILFRNGEKIFALDSEDLELYGTAIPYSDQAERFDKEAEKIIKEDRFVESELKRIRTKSEHLGYMYTKYISFLQGVIDNGIVYDIGANRPNLAKETGVVYVHDDENVIGTGRNWKKFQEEANASIRRGTRVIFTPLYNISSGEPNRFYMHDASAPAAPTPGIYNVDYPTKTDYISDPERPGHIKKVTGKRDKLAIFYTPGNPWKWNDWTKDRSESWIYNPSCILNYDILTIGLVDELLNDRTQRESYLEWLPILHEARKQLAQEKELEDAFVLSMGHAVQKEDPSIESECIEGLVRESVTWWKNKVIFTRPLKSDDAKAWRMIKQHALTQWKTQNEFHK